jgi:microcystin-dependent protein
MTLGMPDFDLTTARGKQDFQKWFTFAIKNEINSYSRQVLNLGNTGSTSVASTDIDGVVAGGVLAGTYPNPAFASDMATQAELDAASASAASALSTHESDTTSVHGISNTANLVYTSDSRLTDSRTPTAHASTHIPGGSDAIDLTKIVGIGSALPSFTTPNLYPAGSLFGVGVAEPYLLYRSTGTAWEQVGGAGGGITISDTAPATPSAGDLWYDSTTGRTYVYYDSFWVEVGNTTPPVTAPTAEDFLPAGIIVPSATIVEPSGWLFCYGQTLNSISNATYGRLFSAIGTTYGGSGASSFVVPDLRGRSAFGKDDMGGSAASRVTNSGTDNSNIAGSTLGAVGGDQRAQQHTHIQNAHSHSTTILGGNDVAVSTASLRMDYQNNRFADAFRAFGTNGVAATNQNTGTGTAQNMPPTIILNYLIKT